MFWSTAQQNPKSRNLIIRIYINANTKHYHLVQNYKSRPKIEIQTKENLGQDNISLTPYE